MTDLTAENHPRADGGSHGAGGTSDDDINAQLDVDLAEAIEADRFGSAEPSVEHSEFDEGLDPAGDADA
ncbi:hypothetical protein [Labedella endophytica]|uniref:Uncharacterized protein n=1 Tax=Labedella endophytica TaxID=1523160 RepID=A0A3S0XBS1_9MICO|nr:hypothetical protein [Labedella endophytica]RUR01712.1 hypothetical protein ELQ94_09610 [Labedella endophytica]